MHYTIEKTNNVLVVSIFGEVDLSGTDALRDDVDEALDQYGVRTLIFDLASTEFIDSTGLGVILGRYKRVAGSGGRVYLAGARPQVQKVLELSGLPGLMEMGHSTASILGRIS